MSNKSVCMKLCSSTSEGKRVSTCFELPHPKTGPKILPSGEEQNMMNHM